MDFTEKLLTNKADLSNVLIEMMAVVGVVMDNNDLNEWSRNRLAEVTQKAKGVLHSPAAP